MVHGLLSSITIKAGNIGGKAVLLIEDTVTLEGYDVGLLKRFSAVVIDIATCFLTRGTILVKLLLDVATSEAIRIYGIVPAGEGLKAGKTAIVVSSGYPQMRYLRGEREQN